MLEHGVSALIVSPSYGDEGATFGATAARAGVPAMQVLRQVAGDTALFPLAVPDYVQRAAGWPQITFWQAGRGRSPSSAGLKGAR